MSYQHSSNRVRSLWQGFVKTSTGTRNATEHKIRAATAKADEGARAGIAKDIQEKSFRTLRTQWQALLDKAGLNDADWIDITEAEKEAVITILGDDDEHFSSQVPPTIPTSYPHPLAPSFSSSTRSTNISSASSYAVVSPNELYSEDDGDPFMSPLMASSNDTSDDEEVMVQPVFYPGRRAAPNGWSSSESLHHSMESSSEFPILASRPLASGFAQNTYYGRMSSAAAAAAAASATSLQSDKEKPPKSKTARQPYIGPHLEDPNEPISEADDFERFKMQTRMEKIVEFHQAAALAEIRLSFAIYRSRKAQDGERRQEVSPLVIDHQKCMAQLQSAKEEERKTIVKRERNKRRSELRGRSNTLIAPTTSSSSSTNPSWLNGLEGQASSHLTPQFDIDTLLAQDPNVQEDSVQGMFSQFFPEPQQNPTTTGHAPSSSRSAVRPAQGFSSASMQSGVSGPSGHARKRRPSDVRVKKATIKGKGLFGDNDSSDEGEVEDDDDDDDDQEEEECPPTARRNPFMDAQASEMLAHQLHGDFELQQTMARLGLLPTSPPPPPMMQTWSPSSRLMEQQQQPPPVVPSPAPWMTAAGAAKEVPSRSTATPVVASGWTTRKNTVVPTPQPTPAPSSSSFIRNPFGSMVAQSAEPSPPPPPPSMMPAAMMTSSALSAKAKGKQAMMNSAAPEPQPIWGSPHKKASPPPPPPTLSAPDVSPPAPAPVPVPPPPQVEKPATPAPVPAAAAASKKMNKKQRQAAAKKGGSAPAPPAPAPAPTSSSSSNVMEDPESTPSIPSHPTEPAAMEDHHHHPSFVTEPPTAEPSLFSSPISRMLPASMGRSKIDSGAAAANAAAGTNGNGNANGFGFGFGFSSGWDASGGSGGGGGSDAFSTPRPPSKIPSHLQHQQHQHQHQESLLGSGAAEGITPRAAKKNPMVELFGLPLNKTAMEQLTAATGSSSSAATIRAAHQQQQLRGSGANTPAMATKSLWNMFSSEPVKPALQSAAGGDPWFPGGFNGNVEGGGSGGADDAADIADDDGWGDYDGDGGGGGGGGGGGEAEVVEEEKPSQPFWKTQKITGPPGNSKATMSAAAAAQKSSSSAAAQSLRRMSEAPPIPTLPAPPVAKPATTPAPVPPQPQPQSQATAAGAANKKGKGKKGGKGKKVTIEEVPDDEDKNIEHLPVDSKVIFLPSPEFSPNNLDAAMSLGEEKSGEEMMMASVATSFGTAPSTAGSSQSDLLGAGGSGAGGGVGWGAAAVGKSSSSAWGSGVGGADSESIWGRTSQPKQQQTPVWGQMGGGNNKDKGKGKMTDSEQGSKIANPTIPGLKRSKPVAGGKLF